MGPNCAGAQCLDFGRRQVQGAKARAARRTQPEIYGTTGASFCAASPSCPPPPFPRCSVRRLPPRSTTTSRCYPRIAAAIHGAPNARRAASVRCCRRSEAEREHQGRRRRRRPAQHLTHIISAGHDSRRPSCHVWRMGDISCSGPREGQESVVLELARAASDASAGQRASGERRDGRCR